MAFDHKRNANVSIRADRFLSAERAQGFERPPHVPIQAWVRTIESTPGERLTFRARVNERGTKSFELASLFGRIEPDGRGGGLVEASIPPKELDYYASRLLSVGTDVLVESPPEPVEAIGNKASEVTRLYG